MALEMRRWATHGYTLGNFYDVEKARLISSINSRLRRPRTGVVFATTINGLQQTAGEALLECGFKLVANSCYVNPNSDNHVHLWMKLLRNFKDLGAPVRSNKSRYIYLFCCGAAGSFRYNTIAAASKVDEDGWEEEAAWNNRYLSILALPLKARVPAGSVFLELGDCKFIHNFKNIGGKTCPHYPKAETAP